MTALRFVESLRYGGKLAGYLLAVALVGGAAVAGGTALAVPARLGLETAPVGTGRQLGGAALGFLGVLAVVAGLLGLVHKLIADAVSAGVEHGTPTPETPTFTAPPDVDGESSIDASEEGFDGPPTAPGNDEPRAEPADRETEATASGPDPSGDDGDRPAPSPGEIVFGSDRGEQGSEPTPEPGVTGEVPDTPADGEPTTLSEPRVGPDPGPGAAPEPEGEPNPEPHAEHEAGTDVLTDVGTTESSGATSDDPLADRGEE